VPREIQDGDGVRWSCAQAYAGLGEAGEQAAEAARADDGSDRVRVVCTPSGGSRSVELELAPGWEDSLPDEDLLRRIRDRQPN
jgi:hypothetical protein